MKISPALKRMTQMTAILWAALVLSYSVSCAPVTSVSDETQGATQAELDVMISVIKAQIPVLQ